ncbi:SRPBCC family protein [Flavobacterium sp. SM15]|uniref:SRPBCC family protein n=1 Tax=Flavobacterium sp. SM15 TaxID=2908005 RepID=UPI001EDBEF67|nr:SRPBCC family protein [Flavobacterium sp. SM15]MCG2612338.1 SRPBCC family protein [Flavobacterium sp. SM15]
MTILTTILYVFAALVALVLLVALLKKKTYDVTCEVVINTSKQNVFGYLKQLKNQDNFNIWVMADPTAKKEFKGEDGTTGFVYAWNGNKKAGEGEQEIKKLIENELIATEIRFIRPFKAVAYADYKLESVSENQTKVIWNNKSTMKYPMNVMISMIEKMLAKDMNTSLLNLKNILEK